MPDWVLYVKVDISKNNGKLSYREKERVIEKIENEL